MNQILERAIYKVVGADITSPKELVSSFVDECAKLTKSNLAYFALLNRDETILNMVAWSSVAMSSCTMIDKPIIYKVEETGLWGDAVRLREPVITNDYQNSDKPTKKGYPQGHVHIIRHLNIPVIFENKIEAVVGVGNKDTDYYQDDIIILSDYVYKVWDFIIKAFPNRN